MKEVANDEEALSALLQGNYIMTKDKRYVFTLKNGKCLQFDYRNPRSQPEELWWSRGAILLTPAEIKKVFLQQTEDKINAILEYTPPALNENEALQETPWDDGGF